MKEIFKKIFSEIMIVLFMMVVIIFFDYFEEKFFDKVNPIEQFLEIVLVFLAVVIPILYLIFQNKIHIKTFSKLKNRLLFLSIYSLSNFLIGNILTKLALNDLWIKQHHNSLEDMFNGCEYLIWGILNIFFCLLIVLSWDFIYFLYKKISKFKKNNKE